MKCLVIGPRGGLMSADVSCATCICANRCMFSGPNTSPWGCFDWVDLDGRRVAATGVIPDNVEAAIPLQRELNALQSARIEHLEHVREEACGDPTHAADLSPEEAEATMERDPDPEPPPPCECGDPDCSQLNGHPVPEEEPHD
jgi:hypothetical protein